MSPLVVGVTVFVLAAFVGFDMRIFVGNHAVIRLAQSGDGQRVGGGAVLGDRWEQKNLPSPQAAEVVKPVRPCDLNIEARVAIIFVRQYRQRFAGNHGVIARQVRRLVAFFRDPLFVVDRAVEGRRNGRP